MGIDIYLEWAGMDEDEKQAQATGFSITSGNVGYLREAYHGGPYATRILVREAFETPECKAEIPAQTMRERLKALTEPARDVSAGHNFAAQLAELLTEFGATILPAEGTVQSDNTRPMSVEDAVRERMRRLYPKDPPEFVEQVVQSFRDFVALAEEKEKKTGKPCTVIASY